MIFFKLLSSPIMAEEENSTEPLSSKRKKIAKIVKALEEDRVGALKRCAIEEHGIVNDDLRRKVWPKIIGVDIFETSPRPSQLEIEGHPYYTQVVLDVNRSLKRFPPSIQEQQRLAMQDQLVALIMRILIKHPKLHYYQGYHDICVTFLLVLGEENGFNIIEKLSTKHLSVFMEETMENTSKMIEHIYPLVGRESPVLKEFLERSEVGVMFCLSWIITWFGHVLVGYDDVVRLFDMFLATDPWMPLYLSASIVLHFEREILELECEMPCVHSFLSKLTDRNLPFEDLVPRALSLFKAYPTEELKSEMKKWEISRPRFQPQSRKRAIGVLPNWSFWTVSITVAALVVVYSAYYQVYKQ